MDIVAAIRQATEIIHQEYDGDLRAAEIAARVYLSPSYFAMLFRTLTGYLVKEYVNRYRLYRAAQALLATDQPTVMVAYTHGFSSQQAFTRSFTRHFGTPPAWFRKKMSLTAILPPDIIWKETMKPMTLLDCFKDVTFIRKHEFFTVGIECDITYSRKGGTNPIGGVWAAYKMMALPETVPDQAAPGISLGLTYGETPEDNAKYMAAVEVSNLDNLPVGLSARKFPESEYAVFDTTLAIIQSGEFWRTFYRDWLPASGYRLPDESISVHRCTFRQYPAIEVYGEGFDETQRMKIYAPVTK